MHHSISCKNWENEVVNKNYRTIITMFVIRSFIKGANPWITVTLAMIGKFQIAASFAVIYVYAGELMPTVVRSEAMGISSFVAGIGLLIFPYINSLVCIQHNLLFQV